MFGIQEFSIVSFSLSVVLRTSTFVVNSNHNGLKLFLKINKYIFSLCNCFFKRYFRKFYNYGSTNIEWTSRENASVQVNSYEIDIN